MASLKLFFEKRSLLEGETPQDFFERVRGEHAFLLESGQNYCLGPEASRYSYVGYDPFLICSSQNGTTRLKWRRDFQILDEQRKVPFQQLQEGDPLVILRQLFQKFVAPLKSPVPFFGGMAGYFSYDFGVSLAGLHQRVFDDLRIPDFVFLFVDKVIAFDHLRQEIYFLGLGQSDILARQKVGQIKKDLQRSPQLFSIARVASPQSNLTFSQYQKKIHLIKELLVAGETYQVNFSQRFSAAMEGDSWTLYRRLSQLNPSSFQAYFQFPDFQIISNSPELLMRKRGNNVATWPIKGTVPRGRNADEDQQQVAKLLVSEKDQAELTMIVDLERNDLGKVCRPGTVKVSAHRHIELYSHVIHTVSVVAGMLHAGADFFDVLKALFPGGSISGCPKQRTMEIIDRLEDFKRGVYTGSAGFVSFAGDCDLNILIRTALQKNGKIYFQTGGGIVMDSDPRQEYDETLAKAKAFFDILTFKN